MNLIIVCVLHVIFVIFDIVNVNISPGVLQRLWEGEMQKSKKLEKELKDFLSTKGVTDTFYIAFIFEHNGL